MQAVSGVRNNNSNWFSSSSQPNSQYNPYGYQPLYFGGYGDDDTFEYQTPSQSEEKPSGLFGTLKHWAKNLLLVATAYAAYRYVKKHHWLDEAQKFFHHFIPGAAKA